MTGGVAFEAIHQAGGLGTPIVVVLNDNGMSIAPNVGALSRYFNRVRLNPKLWKAREGVEERLTKLPAGHRRALRAPRPAAQGVDQGVLGARPVLGGARLGLHGRHRRPRRARAAPARCARRSRPSGRSSSTSPPSRARASRPPRRAASRAWRSGTRPSRSRSPTAPGRRGQAGAVRARRRPRRSTRQVFGEAIVAECERDERVVGITAAMNSGTGLEPAQKALPERYFDVGIAEQQAVLFAAGLALQGAKPVAAIYSTFLQRAFDQIVHDVCLQNLHVVFAMDRAGLVGDDGPTHHGAFDIAYLRCLPNIVADGAARRGDARAHAAHRAAHDDGPIALRYPRGEGVGVPLPDAARSRSRSAPARSCARASAWRSSATAPASRRRSRRPTCSPSAASSVTVADARFAKPLDAGLLAQLAAEHDLLVTVEEGVLMGGFGSAVWETLSETGGRVAADPARRAARPLRDARQARAAARGGRLHAASASPSASRPRSPSRARRWPAPERRPGVRPDLRLRPLVGLDLHRAPGLRRSRPRSAVLSSRMLATSCGP